MGERNRSSVRVEHRDGRKILVIDFRFKDKDGRERRYRRDASVQAAAGARAEAERFKRLAAERGTLDAEAAPVTFAAFVEHQFNKLVMPRYKPQTRVNYRKALEQGEHGLLALLGSKRLDAIGAADARIVEAHARARGVMAYAALICMRSVLRAAVELGAVAHMPSLPRLPPVSKKLPDAPPQAAVERALATADGWLRLAVALAALAGLRNGEVRALEVWDVDLPARRVFVRRAYSADEVTTPKGRDERFVPLAPALASLLAEAIEGKPPTAHVVVAGSGKPPAQNTIERAWNRLRDGLGIEARWHYHTLRHYFATTLLRAGAHIETVRQLLGHHDLASTARYLHTSECDLTAAVAALSGHGSGNGRETTGPSLH